MAWLPVVGVAEARALPLPVLLRHLPACVQTGCLSLEDRQAMEQAFADFHGAVLPICDRASPANLRLLAANAPPGRCPQLWMQLGPPDTDVAHYAPDSGRTVAHDAAMNSAAALTTLAELLPLAQWQELAAARGNDGTTVAHFAVQNGTEPAAALQALAELMPQAQ